MSDVRKRDSAENAYTTPGEAYYVEHGWSGCAGSAWSTLSQATRDGWEAAAREAAGARIESDPLRDLLGHAGGEELIEVVAEAVRDAQVEGRVEYKRRVGLAGRRTIAETVLWRLREHLSDNPTPPEERCEACVAEAFAITSASDPHTCALRLPPDSTPAGLRVEIHEGIGSVTTCKVWRDGVLVFDGVDRSVLLSTPPGTLHGGDGQ